MSRLSVALTVPAIENEGREILVRLQGKEVKFCVSTATKCVVDICSKYKTDSWKDLLDAKGDMQIQKEVKS